MNILHTEWWSIAIPPEWRADRDDDSIIIGDRDDVGTLEISTLCKEEGDFHADEVAQIARQNAEVDCTWSARVRGDFSGVATSFNAEDSAMREWYLACGGVLVFVTYSCELDNAGMDDAAVDEILDTLLVVTADSNEDRSPH